MYTNFRDMKDADEFILSHESKKMFELLEQLYSDGEFKFIYLKNFYNKGEKVFYAFLEEKILIVKSVPELIQLDLKEFKSTVVKKELIAHPQNYRNVKLTLTFENGEKIEFDNDADANNDLVEMYGKTIKNIYKMF